MAFIDYITQVQFDYGAVRLLKQECERVGITRPLVVTDPGVKAAGAYCKRPWTRWTRRPVAGMLRCLTRRRPTRQRPPCVPRWPCTRPGAAMA